MNEKGENIKPIKATLETSYQNFSIDIDWYWFMLINKEKALLVSIVYFSLIGIEMLHYYN